MERSNHTRDGASHQTLNAERKREREREREREAQICVSKLWPQMRMSGSAWDGLVWFFVKNVLRFDDAYKKRELIPAVAQLR